MTAFAFEHGNLAAFNVQPSRSQLCPTTSLALSGGGDGPCSGFGRIGEGCLPSFGASGGWLATDSPLAGRDLQMRIHGADFPYDRRVREIPGGHLALAMAGGSGMSGEIGRTEHFRVAGPCSRSALSRSALARLASGEIMVRNWLSVPMLADTLKRGQASGRPRRLKVACELRGEHQTGQGKYLIRRLGSGLGLVCGGIPDCRSARDGHEAPLKPRWLCQACGRGPRRAVRPARLRSP